MSRWLARLDELRGSSEIPSVPVAPGVQNVQNVQNPPALGTFEHIERIERAQASAEQSAFEERAAIVEFEAGVPREWAEGFARLCQMSRPLAIPPARWSELVDNAGVFIDRWAVQAASLGWNAADIFGCHRQAPLARYDLQGLVFLIGSGEVVAITALSATIRTRGGATLIFRRTPPTAGEHVAAIWELCIEAGGESHG
jgi:hypothetical protein